MAKLTSRQRRRSKQLAEKFKHVSGIDNPFAAANAAVQKPSRPKRKKKGRR